VKKRKQHYVWRYYLKAWSTSGQLWCRRDGKPFLSATENVAQMRDFYRLKKMSERDIQCVEALIASMAPAAQEGARGWLPHFALLFDLQRQFIVGGGTDPKVEKQFDIEINNMEEEIQSGIEESAIPLLDALREGDGAFLVDDGKFADFALFLAMQLLRTPKVQTRMTSAPLPGLNLEASWGLLRTIFATNIGGVWFRQRSRCRLTFLEAGPASQFITGDQPLLNTRASRADRELPPEALEMYSPVSPVRAVLIDMDGPIRSVTARRLSDEGTRVFNGMIARESDEQVYASTEGALLTLPG
jgi:hypothetical protein